MTAHPVQIIAEAAQGYEGSPLLARLLVRSAARGGADAVKFQLVYADELATPTYRYYQLFKDLEMSDQSWFEVREEARQNGIRLILDVFGSKSLDLALRLGASVKLHASDFFNKALVWAAVEGFSEIFISAGGITVDELGEFIDSYGSHAGKITIMYGYQAEPTTLADNNLARLKLLRQTFPQVQFGFMDHSAGDSDEAGWLGVVGVALGAGVIEKHITLDRALQLEDHVSALSAGEFAEYARRIRNAELALGDASLDLTSSEREYRSRSIKIVVAKKLLSAAHRIEGDELAMLRSPLDGERSALTRLEDAVGRSLKRTVRPGEPIYVDDVE